jgi:hypothetical protein
LLPKQGKRINKIRELEQFQQLIQRTDFGVLRGFSIYFDPDCGENVAFGAERQSHEPGAQPPRINTEKRQEFRTLTAEQLGTLLTHVEGLFPSRKPPTRGAALVTLTSFVGTE